MGIACAPLLLLTSCATIIHGTSQRVGISSDPANADVYIDRQLIGQTPMCADLCRRDNHVVRIELDGYQPFEAEFRKELSGWVFGNIVFGGFIGIAVDAISGGLYKLTPTQVAIQLRKNDCRVVEQNACSFIGVVLEPDASWEKIGTLQRS